MTEEGVGCLSPLLVMPSASGHGGEGVAVLLPLTTLVPRHGAPGSAVWRKGVIILFPLPFCSPPSARIKWKMLSKFKLRSIVKFEFFGKMCHSLKGRVALQEKQNRSGNLGETKSAKTQKLKRCKRHANGS